MAGRRGAPKPVGCGRARRLKSQAAVRRPNAGRGNLFTRCGRCPLASDGQATANLGNLCLTQRRRNALVTLHPQAERVRVLDCVRRIQIARPRPTSLHEALDRHLVPRRAVFQLANFGLAFGLPGPDCLHETVPSRGPRLDRFQVPAHRSLVHLGLSRDRLDRGERISAGLVVVIVGERQKHELRHGRANALPEGPGHRANAHGTNPACFRTRVRKRPRPSVDRLHGALHVVGMVMPIGRLEHVHGQPKNPAACQRSAPFCIAHVIAVFLRSCFVLRAMPDAYRGETPLNMMDKPLRALPTSPQAQQQQQEDRFKGTLAA